MTKRQIEDLVFARESRETTIITFAGVTITGIFQGLMRESGDGKNFILYMLIPGGLVQKCYVKTVD